METKVVSLPLLGIQRNLPDYACIPGSCQELINLRNKDGAWRPVGPKVTDENMIIDDLADFTWIFRHPVLPDGYYVGEKLGSLHIVHGDTTETAFLNYRLKSSGEVAVSIDYVGSIIRVVTVYQGDYQFYLAKYDNETSTYIQLRDIARPRVMFVNDQHESNPMVAEADTTIEGAAGMYIKKMAELNQAGYIEGHVLFMLAYRMSDGSFMKHSHPYHLYLGGEIDNVLGFSTFTPLGVEPSTPGKRYKSIQVGKPKFKLSYYDSEVAALAGYKGLIQSLCVFMTKPVSHFVPGTYNEAETEVLSNYLVKDLPDESNYHLVHEVPLDALLGFADNSEGLPESEYFEVNVAGIENLVTRELLPVDSYSNHQVFGYRSTLFNERLHMGDITTILGESPNLLSWCPDRYIFGQPTGYTMSSDSANAATIMFVVRLRTDEGEKVVSIRPTTLPLYFGETLLFLNPILSYPDDRAYKVELWKGEAMLTSWDLKRHPGLNMAYFANYSADVNQLLDISHAITDPGTTGLSSTGSGVLKDTNRIQVSAQNSIFSFPAKNSYRVGLKSNVVLGFGTIGEPISEGQFGMFPLYVFHQDGISTLEQGSGEILYQSIQPIAKDVCNNPNSLISIGGAVLFSTKTGLKIISGRQVQDISDPVEGSIPAYLHRVDSYVDVLSNDYLANLYENLSGINFREFLESAIIAYDHVHREVIVSNPTVSETWTEKYSYVFNLDNKSWHKITENFTQFINNYPGYLGVIGTSLYDICQEDETAFSHVLMQTRPVSFENKFSKVLRGKLCGYFHAAVNSFVTLYLFGSQDGRSYTLLGGTQAPGHEFLDIKLSRSHVSCQYYIFVVTGQLCESDISHLELEYMPTFDRKLR
jgi:hypothetical protein